MVKANLFGGDYLNRYLGPISSNRGGWRAYNETDIDSMKTRNQPERFKVYKKYRNWIYSIFIYIQDDYQRSSRPQSRPLSMHAPVNQSYHRSKQYSLQLFYLSLCYSYRW